MMGRCAHCNGRGHTVDFDRYADEYRPYPCFDCRGTGSTVCGWLARARLSVRRRHHGRDRIWDLYLDPYGPNWGRKLCTLVLDRSGLMGPQHRRPLGIFLHWGRHGGAGYISGWTAYLVVGGYELMDPTRRRRTLIGITRNWNALPLLMR